MHGTTRGEMYIEKYYITLHYITVANTQGWQTENVATVLKLG
jgi:hypothetical protein